MLQAQCEAGDLRPVHVEFEVDKVALGQAFAQVTQPSHQYYITNFPYSHFIHLPPMLRNLSKSQHR